ncbi:hypothetical protein SUDANB6_02012 [Streptomyces sp. enrichment culture]
MSETTAWRYVGEPLEILAVWAPGPHEALTGPGEGDFVIIDGTPLRLFAGRTRDLTAVRAHDILQACFTRQILLLADRTCRNTDGTLRIPSR